MWKKLQNFIDTESESGTIQLAHRVEVFSSSVDTVDAVDATILGLAFINSEGEISRVEFLTGHAAASIYFGLAKLLGYDEFIEEDDEDLDEEN